MNKGKNTPKKSYIFLDESGKPEIYSYKGVNLVEKGVASRYLIIVAVRTENHLALQQAVTGKRLEILNNKNISHRFSPSYSLDVFHAQTDYPEVKAEFYGFIRDKLPELKITVIVAEKLKAYQELQRNSGRLYAVIAGELLKRFLHVTDDVEVIFSRRDSSLKAQERLNLVVDSLRMEFATEHGLEKATKLTYHHSPHYSHGGLQVADYVAHAVFKAFEQGKREWYEIIKGRISYIQDIFNKKSYSQSNPF